MNLLVREWFIKRGKTLRCGIIGGRGKGPLKQIAIGFVCVLFTTASYAACNNTTPASQEMKDSQSVIIGTVTSSRKVPQTWDLLDGTEYAVHIDQKVKGKQSNEMAVFIERVEDGVKLETGKQYLLFLTYNSQRWVVNNCGNSGPMDEESGAIKQMIHANGND
jgi:hypothetical protein